MSERCSITTLSRAFFAFVIGDCKEKIERKSRNWSVLRMKRTYIEINDIINDIGQMVILDSDEAEILNSALKCCWDENGRKITSESYKRYVRYIERINFDGYEHIEIEINKFLQRNEVDVEAYNKMKKIDGMIKEVMQGGTSTRGDSVKKLKMSV